MRSCRPCDGGLRHTSPGLAEQAARSSWRPIAGGVRCCGWIRKGANGPPDGPSRRRCLTRAAADNRNWSCQGHVPFERMRSTRLLTPVNTAVVGATATAMPWPRGAKTNGTRRCRSLPADGTHVRCCSTGHWLAREGGANARSRGARKSMVVLRLGMFHVGGSYPGTIANRRN
jgi:hypothetical protein